MTILFLIAFIIGIWALCILQVSGLLWLCFVELVIGSAWVIKLFSAEQAIVLATIALLLIGCLAITPLRRSFCSKFIFRWFCSIMPRMSSTEAEAIAAGEVDFEAKLFQGKVRWQDLKNIKLPSLTEEEQRFINGPVAAFCSMLDDWKITHEYMDLPEKAWTYLKKEKFFSLLIPKKYGGLEFSAVANSTVVEKLASRSLTAAVTVMVPNSLGPGELLLNYGTQEQKDYYLPRLANGTEIPCFALTGVEVGSDATSMPDSGIVCRGKYKGEEVLGIKLNWNKRYITLAPIATLLGLAFKLYDPEGLLGDKQDLGITVCLLPTDLPGIEIGKRHFPLNQAFLNGPTIGRDVFVPLDSIIGGIDMIGCGWRMLVECLSAGRGISLPALSSVTAKMCSLMTSGYSSVRQQFNLPIGKFEGVASILGAMGGKTYMLEALRLFTLAPLMEHKKPAIATAIAKYHMTETARSILSDAMDIHAGKGIIMGPNNYLARSYQGIPISITVEGANILTRCLIIFGQGATRAHPYVFAEMQAVAAKDTKDGLINFDKAFWSHVSYVISNFSRLKLHTLTGFMFSNTNGPAFAKKYLRKLNKMSLSLACVADIAMLVLGGDLKRKEQLSARLGDVLSYLYISSAIVKYVAEDTTKSAKIYAKWGLEYCLAKMIVAMDEFLYNFPNKLLRFMLQSLIFPFGKSNLKISDKLTLALAKDMLEDSETLQHLTANCYIPESDLEDEPVADIRSAVTMLPLVNPILGKLKDFSKQGILPGNLTLKEKINLLQEKKLLTDNEIDILTKYEVLRLKVINVDSFAANYFYKEN